MINGLVNYFHKNSIFHVWQFSEYAFDMRKSNAPQSHEVGYSTKRLDICFLLDWVLDFILTYTCGYLLAMAA